MLPYLTRQEREELDLLLTNDYAELARRRILHFTTYTMPEFQHNWHHEAMCDYLDAFVRLEIKRLIISMPPRHTKSELVSRRLPALILGQDPDTPIIAASYGADLARRMNRDVQRIMDDPAYRYLFPNTTLARSSAKATQRAWVRSGDMFEVVEYNGYYRGTGVGGAITGMGMKYGIIDDPLKNRQDANSPTIREKIWDWYTSTFRTRLAPGGGILLTMTRWHEDDLAGRLLALAKSDSMADQWEILTLPAIAEQPIADYDRRQPGEALWPDRFNLDELSRTRVSLGSYDWNSLYQQRPAPPEGAMFKRAWFTIINALPIACKFLRYWDKAATQDGGDYTVGALWARSPQGRFICVDIVRGQWSSGEREAIIRQTAQLDRQQYGDVKVRGEQEPGSSGVDSAKATVRNLAGFDARFERVTGDKETRAAPLAAQAEVGNVDILSGAWNQKYLDEMTMFPYGANDDQVDASSGAFNALSGGMVLPGNLDLGGMKQESKWNN